MINSNTQVKRFIKNEESFWVYVYRDWGIVGLLEKRPPIMKTIVSVDIDLARKILEKLLPTDGEKLKTFGTWTVYIKL